MRGGLNPANGHVDEFHIPLPQPGALPGTHWIHIDPKGIAWGSENWAHNIWRLDPATKDFTRIPWKVQEPVNSPATGNVAFDPEGFLWHTHAGAVLGSTLSPDRWTKATRPKSLPRPMAAP